MRSYDELGQVSQGVPLLADDVRDLHIARLLLLFRNAGGGRINGLTKMAKLDFFLRYPEFFQRIAAPEITSANEVQPVVESAMVRYHYGPWDHRYYRLLNLMVGARLLQYDKRGRTYQMNLTESGARIASELSESPEFESLSRQASQVGERLGSLSGSALKNMIYREFAAEVADAAMGDTIA